MTPVLILPGLYNSGPEHWQSRWEAAHPDFRRVIQDDWERPRCADWIARLDASIAATPNTVLVAHSSSCALVGHWWRTRGSGRVRGALLVAPSDTEAASYPEGPTGYAPMPLVRLPFPSIVVASTNDPYVSVDRARAFADGWGSRLEIIGDAGHINSQSGLGDWPTGFALLEELRNAHLQHLSLMPQRLSVCRLDAATSLPAWATQGGFFSVTRTPDELSVVCETAAVPAGIQSQHGWRALAVHGPLDFSVVGVMAELSGVLAAAGVSVFVVSTHDTDHVLVREGDADRAIAALRRGDHTVLT